MDDGDINFKMNKRSGEARVATRSHTVVSTNVNVEMSLWEARLVVSALIGDRELSDRQHIVAQYIGCKIKREMFDQIMVAAKRVKPMRDEASDMIAAIESSEEWDDMLQDAARVFDDEDYFED